MKRLEDKIAIISGGASGQGAAEAELFLSEGAKVIIGDILDGKGETLAATLDPNKNVCIYKHLDVTNPHDWDNIVNEAMERYGKIDILINNAGITSHNNIENTTLEEWEKINLINSTGVFLGCKSVIPIMKKNGAGSIVNISSMAGLVGLPSASTAYTASKGLVRSLTKNISTQYGPHNIRCNSVHPGFVETDMMSKVLSDKEERQKRLDMTPLNIIGTAKDVALSVLFLASDESSYITGSELVIDLSLIHI